MQAPRPEGDPRLIGVELGEGVRWKGTHADGESVVTGYTIVPNDES